jgi:hypothetical protein
MGAATPVLGLVVDLERAVFREGAIALPHLVHLELGLLIVQEMEVCEVVVRDDVGLDDRRGHFEARMEPHGRKRERGSSNPRLDRMYSPILDVRDVEVLWTG